METDAERRERRQRQAAELHRRADQIRARTADETAAKTPGVLDALRELAGKVEELGDLPATVEAIRAGLAAAYAAAKGDEDDAPPPRRRDHLRLVRSDDAEAG
jgi:hypothetical protein